ncbi:hypothetical protein SAMN05660209_03377 [Geodermatophilus africanus]|uniref:Uncharacterized protein n=1 Tax=Geodermatophilus africanus TaxID=1137993 RepID=A0A1H3LJM8_9ACTN|nr:hypothetical protein SAMN05660209_03377 [Geodermatophilus africanus]
MSGKPWVARTVLLAVPVLWTQWLAIAEGAVPPSTDVALLAGVVVAHEDVGCGSGGCWRELTLRGPGGPHLSVITSR